MTDTYILASVMAIVVRTHGTKDKTGQELYIDGKEINVSLPLNMA